MIPTRFDIASSRPLWLTTLADLSLLLVGFFVLLQANRTLDTSALAAGIRAGFSAPDAVPMPLEAAAIDGFARGSARLPPAHASALRFVRDAARDPRIAVTLTGGTDGDVDAATGSAAILANDRARAVAVALISDSGITPDRIAFAPPRTGRRQVWIDLGFAGGRQDVAGRQAPVAAPSAK